MRLNLNLKSKIVGITITIILILTAVFGYFMKTTVFESIEKEIDNRAIAIGKHFTELSADADLNESTSLLQTHLADYLATESYLAYIIIFDSHGRLQAHTFPTTIPLEILEAVTKSTSETSVHLFQRSDGVELEDFFIKSGAGQGSGVHIGIYESKITSSINQLMLKLLPLMLAVILVGTAVAFLLASAITRPLLVLSNGVKRVTRGDLDFKIDVHTHDEIEQLAEAFNHMTGNLRESTVSREFMEKLINTMNDVLVVISPDGTVMDCNRAYSELFGSALHEIIGRHADTFDPDEAPAKMYAAYIHSLEGGPIQGVECLSRSVTGAQIPLLLSLAVMRDENGTAQAIIFAAQDISRLKEIQAALQIKQVELEEVNRNLEDIVASRTAELAIGNEGLRAEVAERQKKTEELRAARDLAESANRSKSEFLANMSHEMRTPLNSIIGGTEYLDSAGLNDDQQRCLTMVRHAGDSLLVLINDLIDLSRIEAGQLEIISRTFYLTETLDRVMEMVDQDAKRKKLKLSVQYSHDVPQSVTGDKIRLQQILVNLVANAVKFTEGGGLVSIALSAQAAEKNTCQINFSIRDTGIGIDPNKLKIIFESFAQADSSITRRFGGSGLGLAISRKLVEAMGGTMQVQSVPGVGSTFSFSLPFLIPPPEAEGATNPAQQEAGPFPAPPDDLRADDIKRVLLVDDSHENRELMRLLLRKLPLLLEEACNGQEALDLFMAGHYDVILMDIQMPIMDGYTATRMMRRHEERSGRQRATIIALTAHAYESDIQKCREAGCDDHIAKPFKKATLLSSLARH